jgi:hypothetical protein
MPKDSPSGVLKFRLFPSSSLVGRAPLPAPPGRGESGLPAKPWGRAPGPMLWRAEPRPAPPEAFARPASIGAGDGLRLPDDGGRRLTLPLAVIMRYVRGKEAGDVESGGGASSRRGT